MKHDPHLERRLAPDRRQAATSAWNSIFFGGRRRRIRRKSDRSFLFLVDHFHWTTLLWVLLLIVLSAADGLFTLRLIESGYHESNPVMHYFLSKGPAYFLIAKYVLTATGLPVLVLFSTRGRIRYALPLLVSLYTVLVTYQIVLLQHVH